MNTTAAQAHTALLKQMVGVPTWLTVQGAYDAALTFALTSPRAALLQLQQATGGDGIHETARNRIERQR